MKLDTLRFGFTICILWGVIVFLVAVGNIVIAGYGQAFLEVIDSIYPGYHVGEWGFGGVIVATLYAALDGFIIGIVLAWLYNRFTKKRRD
jgi:hypothetical protein